MPVNPRSIANLVPGNGALPPELRKRSRTFRLALDVIGYLEGQSNATELIERLVREEMAKNIRGCIDTPE